MESAPDSSPIVILASFLIFLSYIYHKVWQPRHKSFEEEKHHESYALQDHYTHSTPQIRAISSQEFPYFNSDDAFNRKTRRQQHYQEMRPENLANNRFSNQVRQEYQPTTNFQDEPLSPYSEGWPSREHDLNLSENLSAIPNTTRNNIPSLSLNNSFFDNSITNQLRNAEPNREEYITSNLIENRREYNNSRPATKFSPRNGTGGFSKGMGMKGAGNDNQKQGGNAKKNSRRRIYQDSSDSEIEMREVSPIERRNNRPQDNQERVRNYNVIREVPAQLEKTLSKPKEAMQVEDNSRERSQSNNKLNETNYEPELRKKRQVLPAKGNGYSKMLPEDSDIRVQEIFEGKEGKKPEKHIRGVQNGEAKNENGSKKVKNGLIGKSEPVNKNQNLDDLDQKSRQKLEAALRKQLREKKFGIDLSYLNEQNSDLNLRKYVAKKTVQEQAFRISALPSTAESGKTSVSASSLNLTGNKDDKASTDTKSDLFKTMGPGNSGLFTQKDPKLTAPSAPALEKKDSVAPSAAQGGILGILASKEEKKETAPPAPASNTNNTSSAPQQPLYLGSAGLFQPTDVPAPNPIAVQRNQSIVAGAGEEPQLAKKDSLFQPSLFSQASTTGKSLFSNTTSVLNGGDKPKSASESLFGKPGETAGEDPKKSFFSNLSSTSTEPKPAAPEQKPAGIFASLGGLHAVPTTTTNTTIDDKAQAQPPATIASAPSIFANSSAFGQDKPPPPPGQPLKKDEIRPTSMVDVQGSSYTASLLFGPPDPKNSIPSPAPFPVQNQPAPSAPVQQGNQGGNLLSGGKGGNTGGNWLNQIKSEPKGMEGGSGSIFSRLAQQSSPAQGQNQGQGQSQSQAGGVFSNLMATKQLSSVNTGGNLFGSPQKDAQQGQSSNTLFGNQSTPTQDNKTSGVFGNIFGSAGGNNAQASSGPGTSSGLFANLSKVAVNQGNSASSLFGNK